MSLIPTFTALGSGPTVLMLHDADGGHLSFAPQVEALASAGYRAVAWDMPGYGYSAPVEPYGFFGLARRCLGLIEAVAAGATMEQAAGRLVPQQIGSGALPEGVRLAQHALSQVPRATYLRGLGALSGFDRTPRQLAQIRAPALVIGGDQDRTVPADSLDALAQCLPGAQRLSLPAIGHWPPLESPEVFGAALLEFLTAPRVLH